MSTSEAEFLRAHLAAHETLDEARNTAVTGRLTALEVAQADLKGYIRGRSAVLAVILALSIPILTEIARVMFEHINITSP